MLHTRFQDYRSFVLEKKIFIVLTKYRHGGHLGHVTWTIYTNFCYLLPLPKEAPHESQVVSLKMAVRRLWTEGQMVGHQSMGIL